MNIYFDTEFTGLHKNTTLISIGLIDENERLFYAEFTDYDKSQCDNWIKEHVIDNLLYKHFDKEGEPNTISIFGDKYYAKGDKQYIKNQLTEWLSKYDSIELVSDVCHYDMVLFIDLFRTAFDLPQNVNPACHDINQDIARYYNIDESKAFDKSREDILKDHNQSIEGNKHNALYDAKVIKSIYSIINSKNNMSGDFLFE